MAQHDRIIHLIHMLMRLENRAFITEMYRQFLHREPAEPEIQHYIKRLALRQNKQTLILAIMCSEEATRLYSQPPTCFIQPRGDTIARKFQHFYPSEPVFFLHSLYQELLCRTPDRDGMNSHLHVLLNGSAKITLIRHFLWSPECQKLLSLPHLPAIDDPHWGHHAIAYPSPVHPFVTHIGIFLGYPHPLALDGEGIGRFLYRLIEGFLSTRSDVHIHLATTEFNYTDATVTFTPLQARFPARVHITKSNTVESFNQNIAVEVWIVPIVSLETALFLKRPYLVCLHDLVHHQFKDLYFSIYPEFCHRIDRNSYLLLQQAAAIVSNSNYVRSNHAAGIAAMPIEKTHVIRLAPPRDEYQSYPILDAVSFRTKYHLPHEYIVFPTVLRLHKNFERLIAAFIKFRHSSDGYPSRLRLVFTDQLTHHTQQADVMRLLQNVADDDIRSSIVFLNRLPKSDIPSLYKHAVGTIVPTLFEGSCPFPILESLTMGTPVAAANLEVTNEVITDMGAFLAFNPYSIDEIEAAIRWLWTYRYHLLIQQQAAINTAMQRNWTDVAQEYYHLIQHVFTTNAAPQTHSTMGRL